MFSTFHAEHWLARYPLDHVFHLRTFTLRQLRVRPHTRSDHFPTVADLADASARRSELPKPRSTSHDLENAT